MTQDGCNLNVYIWNARSLNKRLSEFKFKLYSEKPYLVLISETWIKANREPTFINYSTVFKHRTTANGGGLACLIRGDVNYLCNDLSPFPGGKLEIQAITVVSGADKIDFMNVYNPNENISPQEFVHFFNQLGEKFYICGDFNAHHQLWDDRYQNNSSGNNLIEAMYELNNLILITPKNFATYYNITNNSYSTLDLTFCSTNLFNKSQVHLDQDVGSDHTLINLIISIKPVLSAGKRRRRWKFDKVMGILGC